MGKLGELGKLDKLDVLVELTTTDSTITNNYDMLLRCIVCGSNKAKYSQDIDSYDGRRLHIVTCKYCGTVITNDKLSIGEFASAIQSSIYERNG